MRREESCQICGRPADTQAYIAGALVPVCNRDTQYGQVVEAPATPRSLRFNASAGKPLAEFELVDDYARVLKNARASRRVTLEELSHAVGIRTNELHAFEEGRVKPTVPEAQKLEKYYKITLLEGGTPKTSNAPPAPSTASFGRAAAPTDFGGGTLADRVTIKPLKK